MNTTESTAVINPEKVRETIHTKLKFIKSDLNGALISFVSQNPVSKVVCGVRQDSPYPKKIVIIDKKLAKSILTNLLYDCTLIPMKQVLNPNTGEMQTPGYVAISATPTQFKATVATNYIKGQKYQVDVSFGNKTVRFDPFQGTRESVKSLNACRDVLERRCDIKDLADVIEDFNTAANTVLLLMKEDRAERNSKKHDSSHARHSH